MQFSAIFISVNSKNKQPKKKMSEASVITDGSLSASPAQLGEFRFGYNEEGLIDSFRTPEQLINGREQAVRSVGASLLAKADIRISLLEDPEGRNISEMSTEVFGYGNEQERFQSLKKMSSRDFLDRIRFMNREAIKVNTEDAPVNHGFTTSSRYAVTKGRVPHIYPAPDDSMAVLQYAFDSAKEAIDVQDAALILAGGFVIAHPFDDGNGRVSRQLYSELSAGVTPDDEAFKILGASTNRTSAEDGARTVEIGSFAKNDPEMYKIAVSSVYTKSDITKYNAQLGSLDYSQHAGRYYGLTDKALEGLDGNQAMWFDDVYANARGLNIERTQIVEDGAKDESFRYALSYASDRFPGFVRQFEEGGDNAVGNNRVLNVESLINSGNVEFNKALATGAKDFYKLYAISVIDMLGAGELSRKKIHAEGGGKISIRDRIVELSNNFLSEDIEGKAIRKSRPLEERLQFGRKSNKTDANANKYGSRSNPVIVNHDNFRGDPKKG